MDFKVQRVSKVKPPPVLSSSTNAEGKARNKDQHSRVKGVSKPRVPGGKPHGAANSNVEGNATRSATASGNDHNQNRSKQQRSYCYAGVEFRPLHITDEGGFSTAIVSPRPDNSKNAEKPQNVLAYEEVTIPSGNFDKINTENILVKSSQTSGSNSALAAFTSDMQDMTHACLRQDDNGGSHQESTSTVSGKKPPPMPKPYSKSKDGVDEPDTGRKKTAPPLPKPYGQSRKDETEESSKQQGVAIVEAVYAVVNKPPKSKNVKKEEPEEEEEEPPPPLPMRPNFELEEDLKRSQEDIADNDSKEVTEKSTKGMGIIKTIKKHMRQMSDSGGLSKTTDEQKIVDTKTASSEEISNGGDKESKPVKAYLVTDIINQPSTKMFGEPETYETVSDVVEEDASLSSSNGLPEGWQEVKDAGSTYYWHVASGTTQWEKPRKLENVSNTANHRSNVDQSKPKVKPELKTVISFPVHSMGWLELEESQVAPHNMSDTIAECISNLARQRKDLWNTTETWGEGKDLRLLLEGDNLKLVDVPSKATLLVQPISKMRVWGAGRDELKDFAYVARDQTTSKHRCHVFRCHGNISGRAIHNKLHEMCNKILAEKKKARENQQQNSSTRQWSDILNTPPKPSLKDQAGFNVKPVAEAKKSFSAKYIGRVDVPKPSGIDVIHNAIALATSSRDPNTWRTCLIEIISFSSVRSIECLSQQVIAEDRIKFVSFIGVAKDVKFCGYITSSDQSPPFTCHVFQCIPNAASFTKALEEACKLRLQSCIDTNPDLAQKIISTEAEKVPAKESKPAVGIKGFWGKLAHPTKLGGKRTNLEPVPANNVHSSERSKPAEPHMSSNQSLVKYYGYQSVSVGTGATAIREAVKAVQGTTLQISNITIASEGITLDDSIKSGLARRLIMSEKISYCGVASDRVHFGVIESQGGGKFICHVFAEYKTPVNTVVEAINRIL